MQTQSPGSTVQNLFTFISQPTPSPSLHIGVRYMLYDLGAHDILGSGATLLPGDLRRLLLQLLNCLSRRCLRILAPIRLDLHSVSL